MSGRRKGPAPFKVIKGGKPEAPPPAPQAACTGVPGAPVYQEHEVLVDQGYGRPPAVGRVFIKDGEPMFVGFGWPPRPPK